MAKKKKKDKDLDVHQDLEGFDIRINEFGEIISSKQVEELNEFLDENVNDKKLSGRQEKTVQDEEE